MRVYIAIAFLGLSIVANQVIAQEADSKLTAFAAQFGDKAETRFSPVDHGRFAVTSARIATHETTLGEQSDVIVKNLTSDMFSEREVFVATQSLPTLGGGAKKLYQQTFLGLPVFDHGIWVYANRYPSGRPIGSSEDGRWDIYDPDSRDHMTPLTIDRITSKTALDIETEGRRNVDLNRATILATSELEGIPSTVELGYLKQENGSFIPAYRASKANEYGTVYVTIDARDESVISNTGLKAGIQSDHATIDFRHTSRTEGMSSFCADNTATNLENADVYRNAQTIDSGVTDSILLYLCPAVGGKYKLTGKFGSVHNDGDTSNGDEVEETVGDDFDYSTGTVDFDQVQAYFHMTTFNQWMLTNYQDYYDSGPDTLVLDYTIPDIDFYIDSDVGGPQVTGSATVEFNTYDSASSAYWTHEPAVIAHEMAHIHQYIFTSYYVSGASSLDEHLALGEGMADWWAIFYRNQLYPPTNEETILGDYAGDWERDVDNTISWSDLKDATTRDADGDGLLTAADYYDMSMVISGSLWDYWKDEGSEVPHIIQLAADATPDTSPDFMDFRDAVVTAADGCYQKTASSPGNIFCCSGTCSDVAEDAFDDHDVDSTTDGEANNYWTGMGAKGVASGLFANEDDGIELPMSFVVNSYPNPFTDQLQFDIAMPEEGVFKVELFDLLGRSIYSHSSEASGQGVYTFVVDSSPLSPGSYVYRISSLADTREGTVVKLR